MANTKIPSELIADSSITAAKLADGTITTADIADSNVTTAKIADSNVTTAKIGDAQVTTAKITDSNVTTGKIADDAVTTAKMASNSVTSDTIASGITLAGTTTLGGTLDGNGNKVLFANVYSAIGDLPSASTYHGMFAHVHGTGKGYFAHAGAWVPLANESTHLALSGGTITGTVVFNSAPTFNTAIAMGSTLNVASSIGIAGTTVIDASRNLTNIGSIASGQITVTADNSYFRDDDNVGIYLQTTAQGTGGSDGVRVGLNSTHAFVWNYEAKPLAFATSGTERLSIGATGPFDFKTNNITNIGTLSSGAITSTGSSTFTSTSTMDINLVANPPELNFEDTSSTSGTKRARWTLDSNNFSAHGLSDNDGSVTQSLLNFSLSSGAATFGGTVSLADDKPLQLGDSADITFKHHNSGYGHLQNSGILYIDAEQIQLRTDNSNISVALTLNSSHEALFAGKVGVKTNSPQYDLDVYSTEDISMRIHRPSSGLGLNDTCGIGFSHRGDTNTSSSDTRAGIFSTYNGSLFLATEPGGNLNSNPVDHAALSIIGTSQNVGIGTISPDYKLDVTGPTGSYANGDLPIAVFQASTDHRAIVKVQNNNENDGASAPRAAFDLDVKDEASGNRIRSILALTKRTNNNTFGNTDLTVPYDFNIFVNNKGTITTSSGAQANSSVTAGNLAMSINASSNIGIGTITPGKKLEVSVGATNTDGIRITGSSANTSLIINNTGSNGVAWDITSTGAGHGYGEGALHFGVGFGQPKMKITSAGSVGIGTNTPLRDFDVTKSLSIFGTGGYTELMLRSRAGTAQNLGAFHLAIRGDVGGNNDDLKILRFTGGNSPSYAGIAMQIQNSTGNVGIGTATPTASLHIQTATQADTTVAQLELSTTVNANPSHINQKFSSGAGWIAMIQAEQRAAGQYGALNFWTANNGNPAQKMALNYDGDLSVGDAAVQDSPHPLHKTVGVTAATATSNAWSTNAGNNGGYDVSNNDSAAHNNRGSISAAGYYNHHVAHFSLRGNFSANTWYPFTNRTQLQAWIPGAGGSQDTGMPMYFRVFTYDVSAGGGDYLAHRLTDRFWFNTYSSNSTQRHQVPLGPAMGHAPNRGATTDHQDYGNNPIQVSINHRLGTDSYYPNNQTFDIWFNQARSGLTGAGAYQVEIYAYIG